VKKIRRGRTAIEATINFVNREENNMATGVHTSVEGVKSTCGKLEISPSHRSATSNVYASGGHTVKQAKHGGGGKTHAGKRGTKETPEKLGSAHHKRGH